jgi:predicted transcriptional regulator|nr:MAG: histidine kinase [Thermoproteus sp. AZ2]
MGLSDSIYNVLKALVDIYNRQNMPVKSKEIAETLKVHEGYIRNIMSVLKSMGLVMSKAGPHGGYVPTSKAYDVVSKQTLSVPIYHNNSVVAYALDISLLGLLTETPLASLRVLGDLSQYVGKELRVGPLPSGIVVVGKLIRADIESLLEVSSLVSIPHVAVGDIMTKKPLTAKPDDPLEKYIDILSKRRYRGIPVVDDQGRPIGLLMASRAVETLAKCRADVKVADIMTTNPPTINVDEDIHEAIRAMISNNIGRLLVIDDEGKLVGIVTRTDILTRIASLEMLASP